MVYREIAIIDIGIGNIKSVFNSVYHNGHDPVVVSKPCELKKYSHAIFPGVGHFGHASKRLTTSGFRDEILEYTNTGRYLLGVCLGMQLLLESSDESPGDTGLSLIPGHVRMLPQNNEFRTPHIGWNAAQFTNKGTLFSGIEDSMDFYFVHSYYIENSNIYTTTSTSYINDFCSSLEKDNIFGTQFHPEKSQVNGLKIIDNFCTI